MTACRSLPIVREGIDLPKDQRPILLVVIDVEEEFDWDEPFSREATTIDAIRDLAVIQPLFLRYKVRPTLVIDYAVASQAVGIESVQSMVEELDGEVGAHQHPWICPPLEESVSTHNSFAGNLPPDLEAAKLRVLEKTIRANFGAAPRTYKAGRYGIGASSQRILESTGFEVDLSPNPPFDFTSEGGPDFSEWSTKPYWFGDRGDLLGVPHSGSFLGVLRGFGAGLHDVVSNGILGKMRVPGIMARMRFFDRLHSSPEGFTTDEQRRLTRFLLGEGNRVFTFSFHSPSLRPGCTPYVQSAEDLRDFLLTCEKFLEFFLEELGGESMTASELREHLLQTSPRRNQ